MRMLHTQVKPDYARGANREMGSVVMLWLVKLGRAIRHYRRLRGVSQETLAAALGVHQSQVSRVERGLQGLLTDQLGTVAQVLGVRASELVAYAEDGRDANGEHWRELWAAMSPEQRQAAVVLLESVVTPPKKASR